MKNEIVAINGKSFRKRSEGRGSTDYSRLHRKFVLLTVICSLLPLLIVGWGINIHYSRFARAKMMSSLETMVEYHRKIIELFLKEHSSKLQLIANTHGRDFLAEVSNLHAIFELINREHWTISDLGVIDSEGRHLAYIGPYDLMDKIYAKEFWFSRVMEKGLFISDMFTGFRKVPHFIIAVARTEGDKKWILRATIDTEVFRSLVENVRIGKTGEVYLLNREGVFQTTPRFSGSIMEKSPYRMDPVHEGIRVRVLDEGKDERKKAIPRQVVSQTWLKEPSWLLVVRQDFSEAFEEVNHANAATLIFLHLSAATILIVAVFISRHMIAVIRKRDEEADRLNLQLLQAGKLASIGELSAGVAHEINNPLAIILTERQILIDISRNSPGIDDNFRNELLQSLNQIDLQVNRCKRITHNLLRFSRRTRSMIETVDINAFLLEVVELLEREAKSNGIKFQTVLEKGLPPILSDPSQLQQVCLNLINNAIDALEGKPFGTIQIHTRSVGEENGIEISIADTGDGIPPENIEKIFDPFFTTKPVGKGTGLGLSICYSIMKQLGGNITVCSEPGFGTEFRLFLPPNAPVELQKNIAATLEDGPQIGAPSQRRSP